MLAANLAFLAALAAGVRVWTVCVSAVCLGAVFLARTLADGRSGTDDRGSRLPDGVLWLTAAFFAALFVYLLPLPPALSRLTGHVRYAQNARAAGALREAAALGVVAPRMLWFRLTRSCAGTLNIMGIASAAAAAAALAAALSRRARSALLAFSVALGTAIAAAGYVGRWVVPQGNTLWWIIRVPYELKGPAACFGNPNHYGGYVAMLAPLALALAVRALTRRQWFRGAAWLACCAVMSAAVVFSLSRGALIALAAGLLITTGLLTALLRPFVARVFLPAAAALFVAGLVLAPDARVRERLLTLRDPAATESLRFRAAAWRDTLRMWRAYPVAGIGPDAFQHVYPQFRATSSRAVTTHAENEYVQALAETGLFGALLFAAFAVAAGRGARRAWRAAPPPDRPLTVGAGGALAVAAVHAAGDFAMHIPLYAVTLASILGSACGIEPGGRAAPPPRRTSRAALACAAAALLAALSAAVFAPWTGRLALHPRLAEQDLPALARAMTWAPTSPEVWYNFGWEADRAAPRRARKFAEACMTQAAAYDPNDYLLWKEIGDRRLKLGDIPGARAAFARVKALRSWVRVPDLPEDPQ